MKRSKNVNEKKRVCIDNCHKLARKHEDYCLKNCFQNSYEWSKHYPHTDYCYEMSKKHYHSFVECNSLLCLNYNSNYGLSPSNFKPVKKKNIIIGLVYSEIQEE